MQLRMRRSVVGFYPAEVISKMYNVLKMHSKHHGYCFEEILDTYFLSKVSG